MKENRLKIKDLVTIGVFAVIYFVVMFSVGMIGLIPILFLIYPTILGIVSGTIVMLFMAKVQKPWALLIFGILTPLFMMVEGHTYMLVLHAFVVMLIAELIRRIGNYNSFKYNMLSFAIFNMGKEYVDALVKLVTYPHMALVYTGAIVGGVIGAFIGKALLKKHFMKAGIV